MLHIVAFESADTPLCYLRVLPIGNKTSGSVSFTSVSLLLLNMSLYLICLPFCLSCDIGGFVLTAVAILPPGFAEPVVRKITLPKFCHGVVGVCSNIIIHRPEKVTRYIALNKTAIRLQLVIYSFFFFVSYILFIYIFF